MQNLAVPLLKHVTTLRARLSSLRTALLTKYVFTHVDTPVAFSVLSCIATIMVMIPIFLIKPSLFGWIKRDMLIGFFGCSAAIAVDLGCTNVAISELSVAMQQTIKATSPAATVLLEVAFARKCHHPVIFLLIAMLCSGSVLVKFGSSDYDATAYGLIMMVVAVISGAFKYVMAHKMVNEFRKGAHAAARCRHMRHVSVSAAGTLALGCVAAAAHDHRLHFTHALHTCSMCSAPA